MNEQKRAEMLEASKPLIKWLNENCNPHVYMLVTNMSAELLEGVASEKTLEFLKD